MVDPLAELDRRTNPYAYGFDDPIRHTDPDGMFGEDVNEDDDKGPGPKAVVAGVAITTTPSALSIVLDAAADIGSGLLQGAKFGVSASAAAVGSTIALVLLPTPAGIGSDQPPRNVLPPPFIPPNLKKDSQVNAAPGSRAGKPFTPKEKSKVIDANTKKNNGDVICEGCKIKTTKPAQSKRGVTPPTSDRQVDHIDPQSKGGSGTEENGQVLCRTCNIKKSNN